MNRTISENALMLDLAASLARADLATTVSPPPPLAELFEMGRKTERLPEGFALIHIERMAGVARHMISVYSDYQPRASNGPLLFLKAQRGEESLDSQRDWSRF